MMKLSALITLLANSATFAGLADVKKAPTLTVLVQNLGSSRASFDWKSLSFTPICPGYKLCDSEIVSRARAHIEAHQPDILLLQELQNADQLLHGVNGQISVLPETYDAQCGKGGLGFEEVCIAWKKSRLHLVGACQNLTDPNSGALHCPLQLDQRFTIRAVSIHPAAFDKAERMAFLNSVWNQLVSVNEPTVVGGDFNTKYETAGVDKTAWIPYPEQFGTLFGVHRKEYGRWPTRHSFFGTYTGAVAETTEKPPTPKKMNTTVFLESLDHVFANFGRPDPFTSMDGVCLDYACLGNVSKGYDWGSPLWSYQLSQFGPSSDHRPILTRLALPN